MGYFVERQKPIVVEWKGIVMDIGFRPDLIVERKIVVELKSVETIPLVAPKIVLTYLRLSKIKLGLLINFKVSLLKDGITRIVNNL